MTTDKRADRCAILSLCTNLAMPRQAEQAPMTVEEWREFARRVPAEGPGTLIGLTEHEVAEALSLADIERPLARRVAALVSRAPQVAIELERLESLGVWCVTEADDLADHPLPAFARAEAAPVLFGVGNRELPSAALRSVPADGGTATLAALTECVSDAVCALTTVTLRTAGMLASAALEVGAQLVLVAGGGHLRLVREPSLRTLLLRGDAVLLGCGNPSGAAPAATSARQEALAQALTGVAPTEDEDAQAPPNASDDLDVYRVVLPLIEQTLATPKRVDEVAIALSVIPSQVKAWIARAESDGRVRRVGRRPVTYQAASAYQPGLFDEGGHS